ncbi:MAG: class I SAM-dependent RNA methyltransferase [Microthrixaceae bacterium]
MDAITVEVTRIVAGGDGLARDEAGRVVFVAGGLPGESILAEVREQRRDFSKATVREVLRAAPVRVSPPCRFVADGCGGCDWQHIAASAQRRLKADIVQDALRRQARVEIQVGVGPDLPDVGYRTTVRGTAADGRFAFRHAGSHELVPVGPCLVAHPLLDELITDGRYPDGEVILRAGARTGERLAIVASPDRVEVPEGVRVVTAVSLAGGSRAWFHEEVAGRRWRISARSFFQARPDGAEALVACVADALDGAVGPDAHLVDLYAGVGLFAGALPAVAEVTVVESGASSVADARVNLADRQVRILKSDVARWRPARADAVVADPPRTGLGASGVAAIAATHAPRLALVSCDPAALGRDTKLLAAAGYALRSCTLVDLFPHTSHVEAVSRFDLA